LLGYSKGAADEPVTLANYPEIHRRAAATVSLAGVIGGSPLANNANNDLLNRKRTSCFLPVSAAYLQLNFWQIPSFENLSPLRVAIRPEEGIPERHAADLDLD